MRQAQQQASDAYNQANNTSARLGSDAAAREAQITPFLTQEMLHPQGIGQAGIGAETGAALGGAGGAASGFTGQAVQRAAASRNAGGFQAALDSAARERMKAAGNASEGIQAGNEQEKLLQQQAGERGLQSEFGTDTSGMLNAMNQEHEDINSEIEAGKSGWLQNATGLIGAAGQAAKLAGGFGIPGFSGFRGGQ